MKNVKYSDMIGMRFGRLTVLRRVENNGAIAMFECKCDCGNIIVTRGSGLKNGHTSSCGCYQKERVKLANTTHGGYNTRLYRIYRHMTGRCYDKNELGFQNYGGRGVSVCDEWLEKFEEFQSWAISNGYSDSLTLDRIDVNGDYTPDNCRWTTRKIQANNTRRNRILSYNGKSHTMSEWSDITGLPYGTINSRIFRGWTVEKTLTTPRMTQYVH